MKGGYIVIFMLLCIKQNLLAYSDPKIWNKKKEIRINLITDFITNREKFVDRCYQDSWGYSAGFGDFSWCNESMKVLRSQNPFLRFMSDNYVRSLVRITKEQAKWRLKKFVIEVYDNMESKVINGKTVVDFLDEKEILALVDNAYTRGETKFYNDPLWTTIIQGYVGTGKMDCYKVAHIILKQSRNAKKSQRSGVLARRFVEWLDLTHRSCVYDVKFLDNMIRKYKI